MGETVCERRDGIRESNWPGNGTGNNIITREGDSLKLLGGDTDIVSPGVDWKPVVISRAGF